jgi:thiamine-phosphate pyrophosphorylase
MKLKKSLLGKSRLYLILDRQNFRRFSLKKIKSLVSGGRIGLVQLRDKYSAKPEVLKLAVKLSKLLNKTKTLFIVNDYVDVAFASGSSGVHLGQGDLRVKVARKILGKDKIIGVSCHNLAQAIKAQKEGADYIGIGPVYATATKPDCPAIGLKKVAQLKSRVKIPCFAIGGIGLGNLDQVAAAGIKRIAVCRAVLGADNPEFAVKRLYKKLKS